MSSNSPSSPGTCIRRDASEQPFIKSTASPATPGFAVALAGVLTPPLTPYCSKPSSRIHDESATSPLSESSPPPFSLSRTRRDFHGKEDSIPGPTQSRCPKQPLPRIPKAATSVNKRYVLREEIGHGAWSTVYTARVLDDLPSPGIGHAPPSAATTPNSNRSPKKQLVAAKVLSRRDGRRVLEKEARILTYLISQHDAGEYIIQFVGFDSERCAILMSCVPLTLDEYVKRTRQIPLSTSTMFNAIIGNDQWLNFTLRLVRGLRFLKDARCIHGDIKPSNILLRERSYSDAFDGVDASSSELHDILEPIFCDFSSASVLPESSLAAQFGAGLPATEDAAPTPHDSITDFDDCSKPQIVAVTTEYTAPEILKGLTQGFSQINDSSAPALSYASDVFSLGVTLLFAATGESPYSSAHLDVQKSAMAKDGRPLDWARRNPQATRIKPGNIVDKALQKALNCRSEQRWTADQWLSEVQGIMNVG